MSRKFLTADWRHLVMLNFEIEPSSVLPHVPSGTELDAWNGLYFVSLVGFRFLNTRVKGIAFPLHTDFDEINLRFYVRARGPGGWRRGVVFVKEVVPKPAIAALARILYNENYVACHTRSTIQAFTEAQQSEGYAAYAWRYAGGWLEIGANYSGAPSLPVLGSQEEFISEHYWGYSRQRNGATIEYRVEHEQWEVWNADSFHHSGDFSEFYGTEFSEALAREPTSVFVAKGSPVSVLKGERFSPYVAA